MAQESYDDQEYQFNEAEDALYEQETNAKSSSATNKGAPQKSSFKKLIVVVIVLGGIIFALYQGSALLTMKKVKPVLRQSSSVPAQSLPAVVKQKSPAHPFANPSSDVPAATPVVAATTTVQAQNPVQSQDAATDQNMEKKAGNDLLKAVNADVVVNKENTKNYENLVTMLKNNTTMNEEISKAVKQTQTVDKEKLSTLEGQLGSMEEGLNQMRSAVQELTTQVQSNQALQKKVEFYEKKLATNQSSEIRKKKQYFVQAVVPGRAWLKAADGTVETVAVGDDLSGYGKVTSIDPYSGAVETSTGGSIVYGLDSH
jgi:hypothetical protein